MKWLRDHLTGHGRSDGYAHAPAVASMRTLSRSSGAFYLIGGLGALLSAGDVALTATQRLATAAIGYAGLAIGLALVLTGARWPRSTYHLLVVGGTLLIGCSVTLGKGSVSAEDPLILFALPIIAGAAFFSWRGAAAHAAIVEVTALASMTYVDVHPSRIVIFLAGLGCVSATVAWLARMNERVEEDPLTGLGNRRALGRRLEAAVDQAARGGERLAVVMIDLDHFKTTNDTLGHGAGDELLVACAEHWRSLVPDDRMLFRYGGDEFALLLPGHTLGQATGLAEELRTGMPAGATASVGAAAWARGDSSSLLMGRADVALYDAKAHGRDQTVAYGDPSHAAHEIEAGLRGGEFVLHYQPVISLVDGSMLGTEALVRWQHPKRGLLGPAEFISLAERTGCIQALGAWTLERACSAAMSGPETGAVGVNVSITELRQPCYAAMVARTLEDTGLAPRRLVIEVTEGVYDEHDRQVTVTLGDLRRLGVLVALDDFGSGWSSLRWLTTFPADILKIDGSFVHAIDDPGNHLEVLSAIVKLGTALGLEVVGEQVETERQARVLRDLGCVSAQGYYFGRPAPAELDRPPRPRAESSTTPDLSLPRAAEAPRR